jgi:hypothetical protein
MQQCLVPEVHAIKVTYRDDRTGISGRIEPAKYTHEMKGRDLSSQNLVAISVKPCIIKA